MQSLSRLEVVKQNYAMLLMAGNIIVISRNDKYAGCVCASSDKRKKIVQAMPDILKITACL